MINDAVTREKDRLYTLLDRVGVPDQQREALAGVIDNAAWMRVKLDESRAQMMDEGIVSAYDNGGSQSGTHENPLFRAYSALWRSYVIGIEKIIAVIPKDAQEESEGDSVLSKVLLMKGRAV